VLVDGAHVGHLERPAELDAQEAEAHVPDLPEGHLINKTCPSCGPSVNDRRRVAASLPNAFSASRSVTVPPAGAALMVTASRTAPRLKLSAVTWTPPSAGRRCTITTKPRPRTGGSSTCSLS